MGVLGGGVLGAAGGASVERVGVRPGPVLAGRVRAGRALGKMSRFLNVLRSWLVMVSVIAAGNTLQSFRDHSFLSEKLYTASPGLGKSRASRLEALEVAF